MKMEFNNYYDIMGLTAAVRSNCREWLESVDNYLALKRTGEGNPDYCLDLIEVAASQFDDILPLPGEIHKKHEFKIVLGREMMYTTYVCGKKRWSDFSGFGRVYIDYDNGSARAVRAADSGINPHYADIIFAYNSLTSMLHEAAFYDIHASCVRVGEKGVLFTGHSGRGKSSAGYALARQGHPILSDEKVLLYKRGSYFALTLSDVIKLSKQAMDDFFPELLTEAPLFELTGEFCFKAGRLKGFQHINMTPVHCLFIMEQTGEKTSRVEMISPARVVGEFLPVTLKTYDQDNLHDKFDFLMEFLDNLQCYRVYFGTDMDRFAAVIEEAVRG